MEPYYEAYAAQHVEKVKPYWNRANKQVFVPAASYTKTYYSTYGAPKVEQARRFSQEKWEKVLKPQVDTAQHEAKKQYDSNLAPHVDKASAAAVPYVTASRENVYQVYNSHILPTYGSVRPYVDKAYASTHALIMETALPRAEYAWTSSVVFFNRMVWPKLRILYGENVEPQLVRISERLGRYRDSRKVKAAMKDDESTSLLSTASSSYSSVSTSIASAVPTSSTSLTPSLTPEQETEQIRAKIEDDLRNWQDKFAKAADKGVEDLKERVKDITDRQVDSQVGGTGDALIIQLEESIGSEVTKLKKQINSIVRGLPNEIDEESVTQARDNLSKATRAAGLAIKQKAQALRDWKQEFEHETHALVSAASNSTLEVIDNIRDLGLQEIGMKWAHMEGVTYKDWSKYHEVKKSFDEWHKKVNGVAKSHPGLQHSMTASDEVETKGMAAAEEAAKELARLKGVGEWKIQAQDDSEDFSTRVIPAAAAAGAQKAMKQASDIASSASEQVAGTSQGTVESVTSVIGQKAADIASEASSVAVGTEAGYVEQLTSQVVEGVRSASQMASDSLDGAGNAASTASESVSEAVMGTPQSKPESFISVASEKAKDAVSGASESVMGTSTPAYESSASQASESASEAASSVSDAVFSSSASIADKASSSASVVSSSAASMASKASKKVYGGAMAQEVKAQKPIMDEIIDEETTFSEKVQSVADSAGEQFADATKAVSEAIFGVTKTKGTVESASSVADEQYSKALAAASSVLYGTQQGTVESASSVASGKYAQAVAA